MATSQELYTILMAGVETSWGTVATSLTESIPVREPKFQPAGYRHILDQGLRGQPSLEFDLLAGPGEGTFSFQGDVYVDTIPRLLTMIIGTDAKTGAGDPYTHTIKTSAAPPSATIEWQQNEATYNFIGARLSELTFSFNGQDGLLTYSAQGMSKLGVTATASAASFGSVQAVAGWQGALTIASDSTPASLLEGQISFKRQLKTIHAVNATQDLTNLYALQLQVTAQLTFDFTQSNEYALYTAAGKHAVTLTFTQGTHSIEFIMTNAGSRLADINRTDGIYQVVLQMNGLHNATDGPGPGQAVVLNAIATQYN